MEENNFLRLNADLLVRTMEYMIAEGRTKLIPSILRRHAHRFRRMRRSDLKLRYEAIAREFE